MYHVTSIFYLATTFVISASIAFADDKPKRANFDKPGVQVAQNWSPEDIQSSLKKQGYAIISVTNTLLGRVKILVKNDVHNRILVMARHTGEILSDRIIPIRTAQIVIEHRDNPNSNEENSNLEDGTTVSRPSPEPPTPEPGKF